MRIPTIILCILFTTFSSLATAKQCKRLHIGLVNWTDVEATTALTEVLLKEMGYRVRTSMHSVPDNLERLASGKIDVFLGNWMPSNTAAITPYLDSGKIIKLATNLEGAKYTLAVPQYVYDAGVRTFQDIAQHADKFEKRIYGLEAGNDGNAIIEKMIADNAYGLKNFKLLATSERIMLAQVGKRTRNKEWIAFLAWEPHPMNVNYDIAYLDGDKDYFGAGFGASTVETIARNGFEQDCPQAAQLLKNLKFTLAMENSLMADIQDNFIDPKSAAWKWMSANTSQVEQWLKDIKPANKKSVTEVIASFE